MTDEHSLRIATSPHEVKGVPDKDSPGSRKPNRRGEVAPEEVAPDAADQGAQEPPD
ncbi:MAG: hypothetical protein WBB07_09910 [Mycobacterium sp.]